MADRTTTASSSLLEEIAEGARTLRDFLYGSKERAQRTIGFAYLLLALGLIMQSSAYSVVCTAY